VKQNQLILDTDGGVDDAQALIMLIGNNIRPDAITTVFGNVGLDAATDNILATLAVLETSIPVFKGAERPLVQPLIDAKHVHGEDGLGGAVRPASTGKPESVHAVDYLRSTLRKSASSGEKIDLLMIGPLTNLALALRIEPSIAKGIGTLTIMGGTVFGRGNVTPAGEFNIFADPEAASVVFSSGVDIFLVPWEACLVHAMPGASIDAAFAEAEPSDIRTFAEALVGHTRNNAIARGRGDQMPFVDPLAAAVVIDPAIIKASLTASVDVALAPGMTRGMTVVDPSGRLGTPACIIVERVDLDRVAELFTRAIAFKPQTNHKKTSAGEQHDFPSDI
jgi:purine nucleosidase